MALALPLFVTPMLLGGYALIVIVSLLCLWRSVAAVLTLRNPEQDPVLKKLAALSGNEIPEETVGALQVSEQYVLLKSLFQIELIFISDIMWVYKRGPKSVINERNGHAMELHLTEQEMAHLCQLLAKQQPKIVFGYNAALLVAWKTRRAEFIKNVDDART